MGKKNEYNMNSNNNTIHDLKIHRKKYKSEKKKSRHDCCGNK